MGSMIESLWGEEFNIEEPSVKSVLKKIQKPVKVAAVKPSKMPLLDRLQYIKDNVMRILGVYASTTVTIRTRQELHEYIDAAIENGIIAVDTETNNSLDPLTCKLMGPCIYTPGQKNAYIPVNHVDPVTKDLLPEQCTEEDIAEEFERLTGVKIIMHNGKFDYQVIKCTVGVSMPPYWDTMIGAKILDENERSAGLKQQYIDKIDPSIEKYSINYLFEDLEYAVVDPEVFALYAATDAYMTYKLYLWQVDQFNRPENDGLLSVMLDIEMPIVEVAAEMELTGVNIDQAYASRLSAKYHKKLEELDVQINNELVKLDPMIQAWRQSQRSVKITGDKKKTKADQLGIPPNLDSPTQLAILLYDIMKFPSVDKKSPRGTGEPVLEKLMSMVEFPLGKLVLERRGVNKLLSTFIDKMSKGVSPKDGRLHASFNQVGTGTGRFSSSSPNLQNVPSHAKDIRLMFSATPARYETMEVNSLERIRIYKSDIITLLNGKDVKASCLRLGDAFYGQEDENVVMFRIVNIRSDGDYVTLKLIKEDYVQDTDKKSL